MTVKWSSSIDGILGISEKLEGINLSAGDHTITFEVTDSGEETKVDKIKITIYETPKEQGAKSKEEKGDATAVIIGITLLVVIILIVIILMLWLKRKPPKTTVEKLGGVTIKPMAPYSITTPLGTQPVQSSEGQPGFISPPPGQFQYPQQPPVQPPAPMVQKPNVPQSPPPQFPQMPPPSLPPVKTQQQTQQNK